MRDEHGFVMEWLLRVAIWFALAGVILFDAGAIFLNLIGLDGNAKEIVEALDDHIRDGSYRTDAELKAAAKEIAKKSDAKVVAVSVDAEGIFRVTLRREAPTLIVQRISAIKDWGITTADAQASTR